MNLLDLVEFLQPLFEAAQAARDGAAAAGAGTAADSSFIPQWGWYTIVSSLSGAVATLAFFYVKARDKEATALRESKKDAATYSEKLEGLIERSISAFTVNQSNDQQLLTQLQAISDGLREGLRGVQEEVRRNVSKD